MRNRNTIEFFGIWERLYNPDFKPIEFEGFRKQAGLNAFTLSPKNERTKKMKNKGYIQIYTGNGKGKTTAALGLALRASGREKKISILQFMKGQEYGEHKAIKKIDNIEIEFFGGEKCIRKEDVTKADIEKADSAIKKVKKLFKENAKDLIILDEILVSIWFGIVNKNTVLDLMKEKPENVELVLTGRYAPPEIIEKADLVTEMKEIKHYYTQNVMARKGIEF